MTSPRQTPRLIAIPLVLFAIGLWQTMSHGERWVRLPDYREQDVSASVELNLALDLQQNPALQADEAGQQRLRDQIRSEVEADIQRERKEIGQQLGMGVLMLVLGIGALLANRLLQRR